MEDKQGAVGWPLGAGRSGRESADSGSLGFGVQLSYGGGGFRTRLVEDAGQSGWRRS